MRRRGVCVRLADGSPTCRSTVPPFFSLPRAMPTCCRNSSAVLKAGVLYSTISCLAGQRRTSSTTGSTGSSSCSICRHAEWQGGEGVGASWPLPADRRGQPRPPAASRTHEGIRSQAWPRPSSSRFVLASDRPTCMRASPQTGPTP